MRVRARVLLAIVVVTSSVVPPASAQTPSPSVAPAPDCGFATSLRFPIHDQGAVLVTPFALPDPTFPNPDPEFAGRFQPGETWALPEAPAHRAVYAAGSGRVLQVGVIGTGDRGGIVVVEHMGSFLLPGSRPEDPYTLPETTTDRLLTVYAGIDPVAVAVGDCVTSDTVVGVTTAQCGAGVVPPCSDLPAALRFEIRLGSTAAPEQRSADWAVAGPAADSIGGTFLDPQVMVDDGLRDPSRVVIALAAPCPTPVDEPSASPAGCEAPVPVATASPTSSPSPVPTPTPRPTPRPVLSPSAAILQGIPKAVRPTCERRTSGLVTGTLAAYDCRPRDPAIELVTYFLGRPADVTFTFNSRAREYEQTRGADCASGVEGIESKRPELALVCYRSEGGRASLRYAVSDTCPGVYIGVLGTGSDVAALTAAWGRLTNGAPWSTPRGTISACRGDTGRVSAPPPPTNVHYRLTFVGGRSKAEPAGLFRVTVSWSSVVTADTVIEIYGIDRCLTKPPKNGEVPCISPGTTIPADALVLLRTAPADAGSVSWLVSNPEVFGGAAYYDKEHGWLDSVVVRARNTRTSSRFVLPPEARGVGCDGCAY